MASKRRYPVLSPVKVGGKVYKTGTVQLTDEEAEHLQSLGAVGEATQKPVAAKPPATRKTTSQKTTRRKTSGTKKVAEPASGDGSEGSGSSGDGTEAGEAIDLTEALGAPAVAALAKAGLADLDAILAKSDEELGAIHGVGEATVQKITALRSA
ncbi:MAG: hypothetical protein AAGI52_06630 [Bacteroidota bacterium]